MSTTPTRIDPSTLAQRLATGSTTVLDVRTPGEHATAAIAGSQLLPLTSSTSTPTRSPPA